MAPAVKVATVLTGSIHESGLCDVTGQDKSRQSAKGAHALHPPGLKYPSDQAPG